MAAPDGSSAALLDAYQQTSPGQEDLVQQVRPVPAARLPLLHLELSREWAGLAAIEQQRLADCWQQQSRQQGYDALELVDPEGTVLARSARVGSGMILLSPP